MSKSIQKISDERMLDIAAKAASIAKGNKVSKTQINKLLSILETVGDERSSLLILIAYINRQVSRRRERRDRERRDKEGIDKQTGRILSSFLLEMYNNNMTRKDARKFLGMLKWLFESIEGEYSPKPVNNYKEFVSTFFCR